MHVNCSSRIVFNNVTFNHFIINASVFSSYFMYLGYGTSIDLHNIYIANYSYIPKFVSVNNGRSLSSWIENVTINAYVDMYSLNEQVVQYLIEYHNTYGNLTVKNIYFDSTTVGSIIYCNNCQSNTILMQNIYVENVCWYCYGIWAWDFDGSAGLVLVLC